MINVQEALALIQKHTTTLKKSFVLVEKAINCVLAEDVVSPINMPPFNQSAMDGYALHLHEDKKYSIIDEVKAGDGHEPELNKGDAVRIFTGAPVPETANAVVMQEKVLVTGDFLEIQKNVFLHENIRPLGEQTKLNQIALSKGTLLTAGAIGYLATLGLTEVLVYSKPKIAIVVTGNELTSPGNELTYGKIYESNSYMLVAAVESLGYVTPIIYRVDDNYDHTVALLSEAIKNHDLVLITGGISVGDYDYVGKALLALYTQQIFHKVKQKPGKPLFYGRNNGTTIFALPGNPAAALTCFFIYVHGTLKQICGQKDYQLNTIKIKSVSRFLKKGDRAQFLKAIVHNNEVTILEGQSSAMLQTFALANAFVKVAEDCQEINVGDEVDVILIPNI